MERRYYRDTGYAILLEEWRRRGFTTGLVLWMGLDILGDVAVISFLGYTRRFGAFHKNKLINVGSIF